MLIDENPQLGGQIYRQLPSPFEVLNAQAFGIDFAEGRTLLDAFAQVKRLVTLRTGTTVLGIWNGREIVWATDSHSGKLYAEQIILATGAYERPVPFPGWTLPGVMAAGGVGVLVKTQRVRPGQRALVAGVGPLLLATAALLHSVGVEIAAVLDASEAPWLRSEPWGAADEHPWISSARQQAAMLRTAGVPLLCNHTIFEAQGEECVERVVYGPVDPTTWTPQYEQAITTDVDLVALRFGFIPNIELSVVAGCRHVYEPQFESWVPVRDPLMRTTRPGVFSVGDCAGIGGALMALDEGRLAGITAAEQAGMLDPETAFEKREGPLQRLKSLAALRQSLDEVSKVRLGLNALITPDTTVCRCEEVCRQEVDNAIAQGAQDLQAVKLLSRIGMGSCQGRQCRPSMAMYLSQTLERTPEQVGLINPRTPVKPVTLGALARMEGVASPSTQNHASGGN
jgi:hydrogen cyanide synthase HcnB